MSKLDTQYCLDCEELREVTRAYFHGQLCQVCLSDRLETEKP
jgi:hypothetical protein